MLCYYIITNNVPISAINQAFLAWNDTFFGKPAKYYFGLLFEIKKMIFIVVTSPTNKYIIKIDIIIYKIT